jgi:membrane-bound ClpP family serine protease
VTTLGLILLVAGAVVAAAEAHYPVHGIAGGAGVTLLTLGAVLAISGLGGGLLVGLAAGVVVAVCGGSGVALLVRQGGLLRRARASTGAEGLVGHLGVVRSWDGVQGNVALDGALWRARRSAGLAEEPEEPLHAGDPVVVERLSGLTLSVRRAEDWELL